MEDYPFQDPEVVGAPAWEMYCPAADATGDSHGEHEMVELYCHVCGTVLHTRPVQRKIETTAIGDSERSFISVPISAIPLAPDLAEPFEHPDLTSYVQEEWPTLHAWIRYLDDTRGLGGMVYELAEPAAWRRLQRRLRRVERRAT